MIATLATADPCGYNYMVHVRDFRDILEKASQVHNITMIKLYTLIEQPSKSVILTLYCTLIYDVFPFIQINRPQHTPNTLLISIGHPHQLGIHTKTLQVSLKVVLVEDVHVWR